MHEYYDTSAGKDNQYKYYLPSLQDYAMLVLNNITRLQQQQQQNQAQMQQQQQSHAQQLQQQQRSLSTSGNSREGTMLLQPPGRLQGECSFTSNLGLPEALMF